MFYFITVINLCVTNLFLSCIVPVLLRDVDGNHGNGILTEQRPATDVRQLEGVVHQVAVRNPGPSLWLHTLHL